MKLFPPDTRQHAMEKASHLFEVDPCRIRQPLLAPALTGSLFELDCPESDRGSTALQMLRHAPSF